MTRFRLTVSGEYDVDPKDYGTFGVAGMLAVDQTTADDDPYEALSWCDDDLTVKVEDVTDQSTVPLTYAEIQERLDAHPELIQRLSDGDTSAFEDILEMAGAKIGTVTVRRIS